MLAAKIRNLSLQVCHRARASHIGGVLSIADIIATLYRNVLTIDPTNPNFVNLDRFILSKGHACVALYAALAIRGFIE